MSIFLDFLVSENDDFVKKKKKQSFVQIIVQAKFIGSCHLDLDVDDFLYLFLIMRLLDASYTCQLPAVAPTAGRVQTRQQNNRRVCTEVSRQQSHQHAHRRSSTPPLLFEQTTHLSHLKYSTIYNLQHGNLDNIQSNIDALTTYNNASTTDSFYFLITVSKCSKTEERT